MKVQTSLNQYIIINKDNQCAGVIIQNDEIYLKNINNSIFFNSATISIEDKIYRRIYDYRLNQSAELKDRFYIYSSEDDIFFFHEDPQVQDGIKSIFQRHNKNIILEVFKEIMKITETNNAIIKTRLHCLAISHMARYVFKANSDCINKTTCFMKLQLYIMSVSLSLFENINYNEEAKKIILYYDKIFNSERFIDIIANFLLLTILYCLFYIVKYITYNYIIS